MTRLRPDRKADSRQMQARRDECIDLVERIIAAWPLVQKQATEMVRGFPSSSLAGGGSGGSSESVVERALEQYDPAQDAQDALTEFDSLLYQLRFVAKRFTRLTVPAPLKPAGDAATECDRCHRLISGTVDSDPNRAGFCRECFQAWLELGRPDRGDFIHMPTCPECSSPVLKSQARSFADMSDAYFHEACHRRVHRRRKQAG